MIFCSECVRIISPDDAGVPPEKGCAEGGVHSKGRAQGGVYAGLVHGQVSGPQRSPAKENTRFLLWLLRVSEANEFPISSHEWVASTTTK